MDAGEAAAIGVDREPASRRDGAVFDESTAFSLGAEAEILQKQDRVDGERVVEFGDVDVGRLDPRVGEGAPSRFDRAGDGEVGYRCDFGVRSRLSGATTVTA